VPNVPDISSSMSCSPSWFPLEDSTTNHNDFAQRKVSPAVDDDRGAENAADNFAPCEPGAVHFHSFRVTQDCCELIIAVIALSFQKRTK
jgi:hypothetical protein